MNDHLKRLIEALSNPVVYPHRPDAVEVVQTHISVVFLAGDRVYKVKKPLNLGFLDYTSQEKRRYYCGQEVALNSRFSEGIYLGVADIFDGPNGINLLGEGTVVESAVLMRRIPEEQLFLHRLEADDVNLELLDLIADRIADIHAQAPHTPAIALFGSPEVIRRNVQENFDQTLSFVGRTIDRSNYDAIAEESLRFLDDHDVLIRERKDGGFIRDCHGDLHLDHVVIRDATIMLVDCIEFNDRFRYSDSAADLAFLLMDLEFQGFPAFARRIAQRYAQQARDDGALRLMGFYKSYRAFVRGKVTGFSLDEPEIGTAQKERAELTARRYFRLARACLEPPRQPVLILMCGLMGSGKSFLAGKLSARLGASLLQSDEIRKTLHGIPVREHRLDKFGEGIYTATASEATYRELFDRGLQSLQRGEHVVIDASFIRIQDRARARALAESCGLDVRIVHCIASESVIRHRLQERIRLAGEPSDGRWELFESQQKAFEDLEPAERLICRTWDSSTDAHRFLREFVSELTGLIEHQ